MSRYSVFLAVFLYSGATAAAASWADATFDELTKDFGSVSRGPTLSHPFRIKNNTKSDITISSVRVSCGVCSSAGVLKSTLRPGEETAVVGRMDTTRFTGLKVITIFVTFSEPQWEEVRLVMQANSRDDLVVSPDMLAFGQVKHGSKPVSKIRVSFLGNSRFEIQEVQSESNYIRAAVKETRRDATEVSYELTAKVRGDAPVGKWYTDVWLKTNSPSAPKVRVPLTVEIEAALTISPAQLNLGQIALEAEVERKVIVRGAKAFKITEIKGTDETLSVTHSTTDSKPIHVLTVKLKGTQPGDVNRKLMVITDLKEDGKVELHARGKVMP
ncbi:MAG: DUF1573 domain-containing protein [Gemmataceae bacterium]